MEKKVVRIMKLAYFFHNKINREDDSADCPHMFMKRPDIYLHQDIKSEIDQIVVLLKKIQVSKDIPEFSDLKLRALWNLKFRDGMII